jgi:hypothetical protein
VIIAGCVVGDDLCHQGLEGRVPAVPGRVQGAVPLHHPAQVAGHGRPEHERGGRWRRADDLPDAGHGRGQAPPAVRGEAGEQGADLGARPGVEVRLGGPAGAGQADDLTPPVERGAGPGHQPVGLEPGQQPAQVAGIDVEPPAQVSGLGLPVPRQLEQDPGFGERVGRVQQPLPEQPDHVGVEAVELAHGRYLAVGHLVGRTALPGGSS